MIGRTETDLHVDRSNATKTWDLVLPIQLCNHLSSDLHGRYDAERAAFADALFHWNEMNFLITNELRGGEEVRAAKARDARETCAA
jgi:hypothetical protein